MDEEDVAIICGGTHYYTQHLLFPPSHLATERQREGSNNSTLRWTPPGPLPPVPSGFDTDMEEYLKTFYLPDPVYPPTLVPTPGSSKEISNASRPTLVDPSELLALHGLLTALDPAEAARWHWRDGRKVRRAIERWWEAGVSKGSASLGKDAGSISTEAIAAESKPL
jgi:tRNA dimethylallyltransferase